MNHRRTLLQIIKSKGLMLLGAVSLLVVFLSSAQANKFWSPWYGKNSSIVLDAYAYSPIRWGELVKNKRLVGFINKASDGLSPPWRCDGNETKRKLCKLAWRQHKAEEELFLTRRHLAKKLGLKWGSYHLGRPGNPIQQALHYLKYAKPGKDDLIALDIEDIRPGKWMSLKDAEIFARFIKLKIGRYPLLYTNHATAKHIAQNADKYRLLSRLNLWYARYRKKIPGVFPMGNWDSYTLWQFSSMHNCRRRCLWRIRGADSKIDVNVVAMSEKKLRAAWPFAELTAKKREPVKVAAIPTNESNLKEPVSDEVIVAKSPEISEQSSVVAAIVPASTAVSEMPKLIKPPIFSAPVLPEPTSEAKEIKAEGTFPELARIPIPDPAPIFMVVKENVPIPLLRPYAVADGPRHRSHDQVLFQMQEQPRSF